MASVEGHTPKLSAAKRFPHANAELVHRYEHECSRANQLEAKLAAQTALLQSLLDRRQQLEAAHNSEMVHSTGSIADIQSECDRLAAKETQTEQQIQHVAKRLRIASLDISRARLQFVASFCTPRPKHLLSEADETAVEQRSNAVSQDWRELVERVLGHDAQSAAALSEAQPGEELAALLSGVAAAVGTQRSRRASMALLQLTTELLCRELRVINTQRDMGQLYDMEFDALSRSIVSRLAEVRDKVVELHEGCPTAVLQQAMRALHLPDSTITIQSGSALSAAARVEGSSCSVAPFSIRSRQRQQSTRSSETIYRTRWLRSRHDGDYPQNKQSVVTAASSAAASARNELAAMEAALSLQDPAARAAAFDRLNAAEFEASRLQKPPPKTEEEGGPWSAEDVVTTQQLFNTQTAAAALVTPPPSVVVPSTPVVPKMKRPTSARIIAAAQRSGAREVLGSLTYRLKSLDGVADAMASRVGARPHRPLSTR